MSSTSPRGSLHQIGPFQNGGERRVNCRLTRILESLVLCTEYLQKCTYLCYDRRGTKRPIRKLVVIECTEIVQWLQLMEAGGRFGGWGLLCTDIVVVQMWHWGQSSNVFMHVMITEERRGQCENCCLRIPPKLFSDFRWWKLGGGLGDEGYCARYCTNGTLGTQFTLFKHQGVTKRYRQSLLTNSVLVYRSPNAGGGRVSANEYSCAQHVTLSQNKVWRSTYESNRGPKRTKVVHIKQPRRLGRTNTTYYAFSYSFLYF